MSTTDDAATIARVRDWDKVYSNVDAQRVCDLAERAIGHVCESPTDALARMDREIDEGCREAMQPAPPAEGDCECGHTRKEHWAWRAPVITGCTVKECTCEAYSPKCKPARDSEDAAALMSPKERAEWCKKNGVPVGWLLMSENELAVFKATIAASVRQRRTTSCGGSGLENHKALAGIPDPEQFVKAADALAAAYEELQGTDYGCDCEDCVPAAAYRKARGVTDSEGEP